MPDLLWVVNYSVNIAPHVAARVVELAAASADGSETGGILLGRGPAQDGVIFVKEAGDPGPNAERRPDFFLRDLEHSKKLADEAWERENAVWVGEWHTHPGGPPFPSARDLTTYAGLIASADLEFRAFVAIIVIPDPDWTIPTLVPWVLALNEERDRRQPEDPPRHDHRPPRHPEAPPDHSPRRT